MELKSLRIFLAVYDARSVSKAASNLGVAQSKVSDALAKLRSEIEDPLFVRTSLGVEPTPVAHRIEGPSRQALSSLDHAVTSSKTFVPISTTDELRILSGDIMEIAVMTAVRPAMVLEAPHARLRFMSVRPSDIEAKLERGELDIALGYFPELKSSNLISSKITDIYFGCYARKGHPLADRKLSVEEFCSAPHLAVDAESSISNIIERWMAARKIVRNVVVKTQHFHCVPSAIQFSDLIVTVPTNRHGSWFYSTPVERIVSPFKFPVYNCRAYWHRAAHDDPRHKWWRRMLLGAFRTVDTLLADHMIDIDSAAQMERSVLAMGPKAIAKLTKKPSADR